MHHTPLAPNHTSTRSPNITHILVERLTHNNQLPHRILNDCSKVYQINQTCPTKGKTWSECGKQNHFYNVCHSMRVSDCPSRSTGPPSPPTRRELVELGCRLVECTGEIASCFTFLCGYPVAGVPGLIWVFFEITACLRPGNMQSCGNCLVCPR